MSADLESTDDVTVCCASCGKAEVDDVKLKKCACNLVKYCSVECQKNHRPHHKKACKKRLAELRDDRLFTQPDVTHLGECPICYLPLPIDNTKRLVNSCCCKRICIGCDYANILHEREQGLERKCPFCREPVARSLEEARKNEIERVKANDPVALYQVGSRLCEGGGDFKAAFEYWTKAAALGDMDAHYNISTFYDKGKGVERDLKKKIYHLEEAAIGGHHLARYNLGVDEWNNERFDRAMRHFIISAKQGYDGALEAVKTGFAEGLVGKEDYEAALRGHQAAVDETKSEQREEAEKAILKMA